MAQIRSLHSGVQTRDPRSQRSRNVRISLILVGTFLALFVGSVIYIVLFPSVQ
jgi:hypothetical protein